MNLNTQNQLTASIFVIFVITVPIINYNGVIAIKVEPVKPKVTRPVGPLAKHLTEPFKDHKKSKDEINHIHEHDIQIYNNSTQHLTAPHKLTSQRINNTNSSLSHNLSQANSATNSTQAH